MYFSSLNSNLSRCVALITGDYVIVDPIDEGEKVKGEIVTILMREQIKYIQREGQW